MAFFFLRTRAICDDFHPTKLGAKCNRIFLTSYRYSYLKNANYIWAVINVDDESVSTLLRYLPVRVLIDFTVQIDQHYRRMRVIHQHLFNLCRRFILLDIPTVE